MTSPNAVLLILASAVAAASALGLLALWWYRRAKRVPSEGRDWATIVASDTGVVPTVVLSDPITGLRGKPDYVLEVYNDGRRSLVPLELKPTRRAQRLYESDAVQVGAYLLLLRATYGDRAGPFGYVRYSTGTFRIDLTPELEFRIRAIVAAVRAGRRKGVVHRSHSVPARCANCPMRAHCDEALA